MLTTRVKWKHTDAVQRKYELQYSCPPTSNIQALCFHSLRAARLLKANLLSMFHTQRTGTASVIMRLGSSRTRGPLAHRCVRRTSCLTTTRMSTLLLPPNGITSVWRSHSICVVCRLISKKSQKSARKISNT